MNLPSLTALRSKAEKLKAEANQERWILGGCSGRMITTPSGYIGDGFITDVDTKANSNRIIHAVNTNAALHEMLQIAVDALIVIKKPYETASVEFREETVVNQALARIEEIAASVRGEG